jgi:hypothetical protein
VESMNKEPKNQHYKQRYRAGPLLGTHVRLHAILVSLGVLAAYVWEPTEVEPAKEIWRKQRREKIYDAICWTALGVVALFALPLLLLRLVGFPAAMASLFIHSTLPWWVRIPAAITVVAGFVYLLKRRRTRMPANRKFLD